MLALALGLAPGPAFGGAWEDAMDAARAAYRAGKLEDAEQALVTANREAPDPILRAQTLDFQARVYRLQARYAEARQAAGEAFTILYDARHPRMVTVALLLGELLVADGRYDDARKVLTDVVRVLEQIPGMRLEQAEALASLARTYSAQGRYADAETLLTRARGLAEPDSGVLPGILESLAFVAQVQDDDIKAEALLRRSLALRETQFGVDHVATARSLTLLGGLALDRAQFADAETLHRRALVIREKAHGPDHPEVAVSLQALGSVEMNLGRYSAAERLYRRALDIRQRKLGPVGSSRVDLQACKLEYSIVSPK